MKKGTASPSTVDVPELQKLSKKYKQYKEIGKGGLATVYSAFNKDLEEVALKVIPLTSKGRKLQFTNEAKLLEKLEDSRFVTDFHKAVKVETQSGKFGVIITERMEMDLFSFIQQKGSLSEKQAKKIFFRICKAVEYCHSKGVAHLDLKLDNILLNFPRLNHKKKIVVKLCDFGFSRKWSTRRPQSAHIKVDNYNIGTVHYRAPEIKKFSKTSLEKADVWSLGVILFTLVTGFFPFDYDSSGNVTSSLNFGLVRNFTVGAMCYNLVVQLLNEDYHLRPSVSEILNDPWFRDN